MGQFNTIDSFRSPNGYKLTEAEQKLIEEIKNIYDCSKETAQKKLQELAKQWSQLVAWSWLNLKTDYPNYTPLKGEEKLQENFIDVVKELARFGLMEHYCPDMYKEKIKQLSDTLSKYLNWDKAQMTIDLGKVYNNFTKQNDDNSNYGFQANVTNKILWLVTIDHFHGWVAGYNDHEDKFIMVLAYPPCPAISPSVLEKSDLISWIENKGDGEYTSTNPYIPTCVC